MSKGSGGNRKSSSNKPAAVSGGATKLGGGKGTLSGKSFPADAKMSQFDGYTFVNGGSYSLTTKDGYTMSIDTENGYNDYYGGDGTTYVVYMQKGTGNVEQISTGFVDGSGVRVSGGVTNYSNSAAVADRLNKVMPYLAELANKWKAKH